VVPRGDPPGDLLEQTPWGSAAARLQMTTARTAHCTTAGSAASVAEQIGLEAAAHAGRGIWRALAVAVADAAAALDKHTAPVVDPELTRDARLRAVIVGNPS
jgi:hypothetical protein